MPRGRGSAVSREPGRAAAGDGADYAARDLSYALVLTVGNQQVALRIDGDALGEFQSRRLRRPAVHRRPIPATHNRRDVPAGHHFSYHVVVGIGEIQIARRIDGERLNQPQRCRGREAVIPEGTVAAIAGDQLDLPAGGDLAHPVVPAIGDVKVPG